VFAVKLNMLPSSGSPQLIVLSKQALALMLHDVLEDCESLREEQATVRDLFFL
jgi:translation initiation factor 2-alpha kinase 4